jgi:prephenate dehydrogenase
MNIAIIGVGLIGGSLGMALKRKKLGKAYRVTGLGRSSAKLRLAKKRGAVDDFYVDWRLGVKDADVIVVCTPVDRIAASIKRILPYVKRGAVITDAGSVKGQVIKEAGKKIAFVGVHPMAGSEKAGVRFAQADLFDNACAVIAEETTAGAKQIGIVKKMWSDAGARTLSMSAKDHDRITAFTSHVPHLLAFSLAKRLGELDKKDKRITKLIAGSFRDLTRVAGSNPSDWAAICNYNKKEIIGVIDWLTRELRDYKTKLGSINALDSAFKQGSNSRRTLIGN